MQRMNTLRYKVWPVVAGFIVASIAMLLLEWINSLFFPLPENLDWMDPAAVQAFTASLPWTAYVLVILGYIIGSFKGGFVTTYFSGETTYRMSLVLGVLLTLAAIANILMLGHSYVFAAVSLPTFIVFSYLGHRYRLRGRAQSSVTNNY